MQNALEFPSLVPSWVPPAFGPSGLCAWLQPNLARTTEEALQEVALAAELGQPVRVLLPPRFFCGAFGEAEDGQPLTGPELWFEDVLRQLGQLAQTPGCTLEIGCTASDLGPSRAWVEGDPAHRSLTAVFNENWHIRMKVSPETMH